ncbi:hypothetical protein [Fictibacillus barbaricus]|uniref:Uncharacterized protein n=1 Tax=Fictibacillus barbaricus TaxID=182136 RepID=A0ABU1U5F5_9BACL|nr:hypothetical protein [Fictibacillus barbaricus]MDR7074725.1 hypothetical protein [Fictibacillus barbaricus]
MEKIIDSLYIHTKDSLVNHDLKAIDENNKLLKEILRIYMKNTDNAHQSKLIDSFISYYDELIKISFDLDREQLGYDLLLDFYEILNEYKKINYYLDDGIEAYINSLKSIDSKKMIEGPIELLYKLFINAGIGLGKSDNNIPLIIRMIYKSFKENNNLNENEKNKNIDRFFNSILTFSYYTELTSDFHKDLIEKSIVQLILYIINKRDLIILKSILLHLHKQQHMYKDRIMLEKLFLTITVYIYYLIFKEELISVEDKNSLKEFLNEINYVFRDNLYNYEENIWEYYEEVSVELRSWEIMPDDEAKWIIMSSVVNEFYILVSIISVNFNLFNVSKDILDKSKIFGIVNNYLNNNEISPHLDKIYEDIVFLFGVDRNKEADLLSLKEQLLKIYKDIEVNELRYLNQQSIDCLDSIKIKFEEKMNIFPFQHELEEEQIYDIYIEHSFKEMIYFLLQEKNIDEHISVKIWGYVENKILSELNKYGINTIYIPTNSNNKINILLDEINDLEINTNTNINTFVSGITSDDRLLYSEPAQKMEQLKLIENQKKLHLVRKKYWLGFDSTKLKISVDKFEMILEDFEKTNLEEYLVNKKEADENYLINVTNDIYLPFSNEEALEFNNLRYKFIKFKIKLSIYSEENSGFLIILQNK